MINLDNLNRQHQNIKDEIVFIENEISKENGIDAGEIAFHISKLAGLLKIHLLEEDRFLYPSLLQNSEKDIVELTKQYINEMGNLSKEYVDYKSKYNIRSKINQDIIKFINDSKRIIQALKERINKEERELYRMIQLRNI